MVTAADGERAAVTASETSSWRMGGCATLASVVPIRTTEPEATNRRCVPVGAIGAVRSPRMLNIAGKSYVAPEERDRYVEPHQDPVRRARGAPGCRDVAVMADPLEPGRVNTFELWESEEHPAAWRAVANAPTDAPPIMSVDVQKHQIRSFGPPF
jgi:quinol monooxygenase YgiN